MPTFKIITAALALTAIGAASMAMANESDAEHTEPTHTQGSHSDHESPATGRKKPIRTMTLGPTAWKMK